MTFLTTARGVLGVALLAAAFLPWLAVGDFTVSCVVTPADVQTMAMPNLFGHWMLPLAALALLVQGLRGRPTRLLSVVAGLSPWVVLVTMVAWDQGAYALVAWGAYVGVGIGVVLVLDGVGALGRPVSPSNAPDAREPVVTA